jgi:hypothetical protein
MFFNLKTAWNNEGTKQPSRGKKPGSQESVETGFTR